MPEKGERTRFLAKVPLFEGLKERQLERLGGRFVQRAYKTGQDIVTQGKGGAGLFILVSGAAEAIRVRSDGSKAVVNTCVTLIVLVWLTSPRIYSSCQSMPCLSRIVCVKYAFIYKFPSLVVNIPYLNP